ncbi:MAG: M42 family peptidase [Clostridia bacterium]|nr:M42 family peptidase [Clostridia bacterium]
MDGLKELLFGLSRACCITGGGEASEIVLAELARLGIPARTDAMGSIIAQVCAPLPGRPHLLLDAHLDEIGFTVTSIDEAGFLHVDKTGGPDLRVLAGHEVTVCGREPILGVFCCKPPHLTTAEDYKQVPSLDESAVDIGLGHDDACRAVSLGDFVFLRREPTLLEGGIVTGKALDNRAGVAAVLRTLSMLEERHCGIGLTALFPLAEETGERGATTGAFAVAPDMAIVVDTSFALTPDAPAEKCGRLGQGPMIGIAPTLSGEVTRGLIDTAAGLHIPFQREIMAGRTGTDADVISVSRAGVRTGLVSVPLRYMHTANEAVALEDISGTAALIAEFIRKTGGLANA